MQTIGFVSERVGTTTPQRATLARILGTAHRRGFGRLTHGDTRGDVVAHALALKFDPPWVIDVYPPNVEVARGHMQPRPGFGQVHPPAEYLTRARAVVDACNTLVACPSTPRPGRMLSGPWFAALYAHRADKTAVVILPDGSIIRTGERDQDLQHNDPPTLVLADLFKWAEWKGGE